jgi:hypothetical protein
MFMFMCPLPPISLLCLSLSSISDCVRPISLPSLGLRVYPVSLPLVVPQPSRFVQMCNVIGDTVLCLLPFLPFSPSFLSLCLHIPSLCPPFLSCFLSLFGLCCVGVLCWCERKKNCLDPWVKKTPPQRQRNHHFHF